MTFVRLPRADRSIEHYEMGPPADLPVRAEGPFDRVAFAAVHVVQDPLAEQDPWLDVAIDWDARSPIAAISGGWASPWPRRWTRPSAAWGSTGRARSS